MKMKIGVGVAVLSALAAEGKDFNREELNAMLDKLAASPEPKVRRGPQATCYKMAMPLSVESSYKCAKCGAVTKYFNSDFDNTLAFYRDAVVQLKGMGLNIALDESALCHVCTPGPSKPVTGRLKVDNGSYKAGEKVRIVRAHGNMYLAQAVPEDKIGWIRRESVSNGVVVVNWAYPVSRIGPGINPVITTLRRGDRVKTLPRSAGDPENMLRIDASQYYSSYLSVRSCDIVDLDYGDGSMALDDRIENLQWIINGTRIKALRSDFSLLKTFLSGDLVYRFNRDQEVPMQKQLPRLRELLGVGSGK